MFRDELRLTEEEVTLAFYGCQLGGGQFHGDHREGADIVGMADWVSEKGQKSTLYELNTLSVGLTHSLSPPAL